MPEVVRGSRLSIDEPRQSMSARRGVHFGPDSPSLNDAGTSSNPLEHTSSPAPLNRGDSHDSKKLQRRGSSKYEDREQAAAYYDSRAATKREFKRRASTLQEYYKENPSLLPQLPFTWKHGWKRWKLFGYIGLIFVDACAIPIILYYTMRFIGNVEGWIIFAVVATIWGGPTYVEFAVRSWRLIKKEDFFRPLGTRSRWAFDYVHYLSSFAIGAVTAFLIIGSAPHIVWLRILSLPGPALLLVLGVGILWVQVYHVCQWKAPFRLSSTDKGEPVKPGVFYIIEDVVAVNAGAGRPYREAINARYEASPMFQQLMRDLSWAWCVPSITIAIVLIVLICVHQVDKEVAYGLGWGVPFLWMAVWGLATIPYCKRYRQKEKEAWMNDRGIDPEKQLAEVDSTRSESDNTTHTTPIAPLDSAPSVAAATIGNHKMSTAVPIDTEDLSPRTEKPNPVPATPEAAPAKFYDAVVEPHTKAVESADPISPESAKPATSTTP